MFPRSAPTTEEMEQNGVVCIWHVQFVFCWEKNTSRGNHCWYEYRYFLFPSLPSYIFYSGHILLWSYDKCQSIGLVAFFFLSALLWYALRLGVYVCTCVHEEKCGGFGVRHRAKINQAAFTTSGCLGGCLIICMTQFVSSSKCCSLHLPGGPSQWWQARKCF